MGILQRFRRSGESTAQARVRAARKGYRIHLREQAKMQRALQLQDALARNEWLAANGDVLENGTWRSAKRVPW